MKKHLSAALILGILSSLPVYALDEENKTLVISGDDIKIEIRDAQKGTETGQTIMMGKIMVKVGGKWYPFKNEAHTTRKPQPDESYIWEVK